jgi:protein phosphatase
VDIVGDVHGCVDETQTALEALGHKIHWPKDPSEPADVSFAPGRVIAFVGDLTDRGPRSKDALRLTEGVLLKGGGCVMGNHDNKLLRALAGHKLQVANGLETTLEELEDIPEEAKHRWRDMLHKLPHQLIVPCANKTLSQDGLLTIVHASAPEKHQDQENKNSFSRAMYGYPSDQLDKNGNLVREDWAQVYEGQRGVVHGHTPLPKARLLNNVGCIDTGAVFGGQLSVLSADTGILTQVQSRFCAKERPGVTKDITKGGTVTQTQFEPEITQKIYENAQTKSSAQNSR